MDKLRECPFCSGEANTTVFRGITGFLCDNCGGIISFRHKEEHGQAISAWNARAEQPNEPLTLDELRQMSGEPVYCVGEENSGLTDWGLVNNKEESVVDNCGDWWDFKDYGKTWLAYRQKPKEDD